jgi:hypothetical protein
MMGFAKELAESGHFVDAQGLASPDEARIVRATKNGTAGRDRWPFPESKEFLAGYGLSTSRRPSRPMPGCSSLRGAGKRRVPMNMAIEVRQVMSAPKTDGGLLRAVRPDCDGV